MRAWVVDRPGAPLARSHRADPEPGPGEVRVRVHVCGVCRTDLHLADGDLSPRRPRVVPGHEIVGTVDRLGDGARRFGIGDRVGIAWLRSTCGTCPHCRRGAENLCLRARFTGWDDDGGYAELATVDERFAYALPSTLDDEHVAPLLCAGIIGYRALLRVEPVAGGALGIWGFGASAHITAQVAAHLGMRVHVRTRSPAARELATRLGADSVGDTFDPVPEALTSAVTFAPAGEIVPTALAALDRGGTLAVAGIHLTDIPPLRYAEHLFQGRQLRSVTANTRADGEALLELAVAIPVTVTTTPYAFDDAERALRDLAEDRVDGAAVLRVAH